MKQAFTSEILDRVPPHSIDAEHGVLGSIILNPDVADDIASILRGSDFYDHANRCLFEHLMALRDEGSKVDLMILSERLKLFGDWEPIGGAAHLARVAHCVPNYAHAKYYAEIVREKAIYRSLIDCSTETLRDAYDESSDTGEILGRAEERLFTILERRLHGKEIRPIKEVLHESMDRLDAKQSGNFATNGVETGFTELDSMTTGLHNSELIILAARPAMGKTSLAQNIVEHVAITLKVPTLFVSLEMSAIELSDRFLSSVARVNGHHMRTGTVAPQDMQKLVEKAMHIAAAPLYIDDSPARTITEICAGARRVSRKEDGLGLIVIDYLQLIEPDNHRDSRQEQVAKMARRLKGMARELKIPVLCLAQLNRQVEGMKDHRPRMSHLRESGGIENDADVVMLVHREEYYRSGAEAEDVAGLAEIIVAKQRNGPTGTAHLVWRKEYTRFENKAHAHYNEFENHNAGYSPDVSSGDQEF